MKFSVFGKIQGRTLDSDVAYEEFSFQPWPTLCPGLDQEIIKPVQINFDRMQTRMPLFHSLIIAETFNKFHLSLNK